MRTNTMAPRAVRTMTTTVGAVMVSMLCASTAGVRAQDRSLEYPVKAVFLFNFVKFVQWPPSTRSGPIAICVAERNPFGDALQQALREETVEGRALIARVVEKPQRGCDVIFVPLGVSAKPYLQAARGSATLTVGEDAAFLGEGGIINLFLADGSVRFEINAGAAERAQLRISSHLLRLARAGPEAAR